MREQPMAQRQPNICLSGLMQRRRGGVACLQHRHHRGAEAHQTNTDGTSCKMRRNYENLSEVMMSLCQLLPAGQAILWVTATGNDNCGQEVTAEPGPDH